MGEDAIVRVVPVPVYEYLRSSTISRAADVILSARKKSSSSGTSSFPLHPGDRFGDFLIWLWRDGDKQEVTAALADLLAELRYHGDGADKSITLSDLLLGVNFSTSPLSDQEAEELLAMAETDVPKHFRDDVTSPG